VKRCPYLSKDEKSVCGGQLLIDTQDAKGPRTLRCLACGRSIVQEKAFLGWKTVKVSAARLDIAEESHTKTSGIKQKIISLDKKYGVFKIAKFGIASGTGFLVSEVILTLGDLPLYGTTSIPSVASSSPPFLALEIGALAFGVFIAFIMNERFTFHVRPTPEHGRWNGRAARLLRFEGVNAVGNAVVIVVQFALLAALSLSPLIGNVVGAIVSYPITYLISLRFVWKG